MRISPFLEAIYSTIGRRVPLSSLYIASEGAIGWSPQGSQEFIMNSKGILFGFEPIDSNNGRCLNVTQVTKGQIYRLCISTPNGLIQYQLGDLVEIVQESKQLRCRLLGRENLVLNVGDEMLAETVVFEVIKKLLTENEKLEQVFLYPDFSSEGGYYQWIFCSIDSTEQSLVGLTEAAENYLFELHRGYSYNRHETKTILPCKGDFLAPESYNKLLKKGMFEGNFKVRNVFKTKEDFLEYLP